MKNVHPKATIMIPTYNQAYYIKQAIDSALAQDYSNLEVVVSDDASTDNTMDIVASYTDSRVKYFRNNQNLGRVGNYRKTLYEYAKGKYVLNLDGDDWLVDNSYLSKAVAMLESDEDIILVFGKQKLYFEKDHSYFEPTNKCLPRSNVLDGNTLFLEHTARRISIPHLSSVYRRKEAIEEGFFVNDIIGSDADSIRRLILGKKVGFVNTFAGIWRIHSTNASQQNSYQDAIQNLESIEALYRFVLEKKIFDRWILEWWRYRTLNDRCSRFFFHNLARGNFRTCFQFVVIVFKQKPLLIFSLFLDFRTPLRMLYDKIVNNLKKTAHSQVSNNAS